MNTSTTEFDANVSNNATSKIEQVQICAKESIFRPATFKEKQLMALLRQMNFCNEDSFLRYVWSHKGSVGLHYANNKNNVEPLAHLCSSEDEALNKGFQHLSEDVGELEARILEYKKLHCKFFSNQD